jgi:uncharacterized peroxidase-related enzyme
MSRINPVDRTTANDVVRRSFDAVERQLGVVPNMMRTMAQSPVVLEAYLGFAAVLRRSQLSAALQEQLALAVAEVNACDYCLSAHSVLGAAVGLSSEQVAASREGRDSNPRSAAALTFARAVVERRGAVTDQELAQVRGAGFSDAEIVEIIAHVAINVLTNYFNRTAETDIDFPKVTAGQLV